MSPFDESSLARVYRERAAALARPAAVTRTTQDRMIAFLLSSETYGLPVRALERVHAKPICARIPGASSRWAGVFVAQGEIVPILHLARVLGLPEGQTASGEHVLILRTAGRRAGLLVERALEIRDTPMDGLRPAGSLARYLKGICPDNTLVLDLDLLVEQELSR